MAKHKSHCFNVWNH